MATSFLLYNNLQALKEKLATTKKTLTPFAHLPQPNPPIWKVRDIMPDISGADFGFLRLTPRLHQKISGVQ